MRRCVILDKSGEDHDTKVFHCVFWYPVPAGREALYANPNATSVLTGEGALAPTTAELNALKAGTVHEESDNIPLTKRDANGDTLTTGAFLTSAAAQIEAIYLARLAEIEGRNPKVLYGSTYSDESGWVLSTTP
jgi:hypothetical protein